MKFSRDVVRGAVVALSQKGRVLFSLLCAERMNGCCWAFARKEGWDVSSYLDGCSWAFEQLPDVTEVPQRVDALRSSLDDAIPRSDEHGDPLAIQAQSGMFALLCALDLWKRGDAQEAANAAGAVVDALDNYEYFISESLTSADADPREYLLLDREIAWQTESIERIRAAEPLDRKGVSALRALNRSYVVPPAL